MQHFSPISLKNFLSPTAFLCDGYGRPLRIQNNFNLFFCKPGQRPQRGCCEARPHAQQAPPQRGRLLPPPDVASCRLCSSDPR